MPGADKSKRGKPRDLAEFGIRESDLAEQFVRASGPGGQNVNKVATAVQLRFDVAGSLALSAYQKSRLARIASHLMTAAGELVIEASRFRTQGQNRIDARARLAALVAEASRPPPPKRKKTRPGKAAIEKRLKSKAGRGAVKRLRRPVPEE